MIITRIEFSARVVIVPRTPAVSLRVLGEAPHHRVHGFPQHGGVGGRFWSSETAVAHEAGAEAVERRQRRRRPGARQGSGSGDSGPERGSEGGSVSQPGLEALLMAERLHCPLTATLTGWNTSKWVYSECIKTLRCDQRPGVFTNTNTLICFPQTPPTLVFNPLRFYPGIKNLPAGGVPLLPPTLNTPLLHTKGTRKGARASDYVFYLGHCCSAHRHHWGLNLSRNHFRSERKTRNRMF